VSAANNDIEGQERRIATLIQEFDAQGWHRTGTDGDRQSGEWIESHVRALGLEPRREELHLERVDPGVCTLEAEGRRIEGLPLFDSVVHPLAIVSGRLAPLGSGGEIGILEASPRIAHELPEIRKNASEEALVLITVGDVPGLAMINAADFAQPSGPPVLLISSEYADWVRSLMSSGEQATLRISATTNRARSWNVLTTRAGTDPSRPPVIVNTPRSGWWEVAAERGGGLACWMEVMRAVAAVPVPSTVVFTATSGHEIGYLGFNALVAGWPESVSTATWVHFGANIGAASGSRGTVFAADEAMAHVVRDSLPNPVPREMRYQIGSPGGGEMSEVHARGGRSYVALTNDNAYFHMEADRYPENVDVATVAYFARCFTQVTLRLAGGGKQG